MLQKSTAHLLRRISYRLDPPPKPPEPKFKSPKIFDDLSPEFEKLYRRCIPFTKTSVDRLIALYTAVDYIVAAEIPGAFVECGVWRGGSSMMSALRLKELDQTDRMLYLYDTYAGMSEPTDLDVSFEAEVASNKWKSLEEGDKNLWDFVPIEEVKQNMQSTGYPEDHIQFIKGKVEDTIPSDSMPESIALLRLDTDWYESTYHEMCHLYPRLSPGGVLIVDDYGHWEGAQKAVDRYFEENNLKLYLHRIDYTGRLVIKPN